MHINEIIAIKFIAHLLEMNVVVELGSEMEDLLIDGTLHCLVLEKRPPL